MLLLECHCSCTESTYSIDHMQYVLLLLFWFSCCHYAAAAGGQPVEVKQNDDIDSAFKKQYRVLS